MKQITNKTSASRSNSQRMVLGLLNYVPYAPFPLTCLRVFVPYVLLCFCAFVPSCLRALRFFMPYVPLCLTLHGDLYALLTRLIYVPCAPFSSALHALFMCLKMFLG